MENNALGKLLKEAFPEQEAPEVIENNVFKSTRSLNVLLALGELYFVVPTMIFKQLSDRLFSSK